MQRRHRNINLYFEESSRSSREFYIPYLEKFKKIENLSVLEIGCGDGGNLVPFYEIGCKVVGVDLSEKKIETGLELFARNKNGTGKFELFNMNFFDYETSEKFDVILVHDVIEHIHNKKEFIEKAKSLLSKNGLLFFAFPAWQMPFGGHQQICENKICSKLPFIHLLPNPLYVGLLKIFGENEGCIHELTDIKECRTSIEFFEKIIRESSLSVTNRTLWLINPHYKVKFGLQPAKLPKPITKMKYVRNFLTTSCFYLLRNNEAFYL